MNKSSPSSTFPNAPTYFNGNRGSRYVPTPLDTHLVAHEHLTSNCWMAFGCIHCIQDKESYEVLEQPITISVRRNGFGSIIKGICLYWIITEHAKKTVQNALEEEVKATLEKDNILLSAIDVKLIVSGESKMKQGPHKDISVGITASTDMGWQKRSSGHRYDSPSGHMFFIGALTKKIIAFQLFSKNCSICKCAKKKGKPVRVHPCPKNFSDSSKAMEAVGAHKIIENIYLGSSGALYCKEIIADDDSTMKAHCSHAKGLDKMIPEPIFLADPSHRCKVVAKPMYKLANAPKKTSLVTKNDAKRIKFYYSYFIRVNRCKEGVTAQWMSKHVWCVLYHLFDDHHLCTSDFCWKKKEQEDRMKGQFSSPSLPSQSALLQKDDEETVASDPVLCIKIIDTQGDEEFEDNNDDIFEDIDENIVNDNIYDSLDDDQDNNLEEDDDDIDEMCVNDNGLEIYDEDNEEYTDDDIILVDGKCDDNLVSIIDDTPSRLPQLRQTATQTLHSLRKHKGYYRSMTSDKIVFEQMKEKFEQYTTESAMIELLHPYDTQTNEGMNTAVAVVAPKHKNYSRSVELSCRIHFIVGMKNVGRSKFVTDVLMSSGFANVPTVLCKFLNIEDARKRRKQIRESSVEFKSNRCETNVLKAIVERKDEIKANVKGTSYGAFVVPKLSKPKENLCRYKDFGCLIADGHKTTRCQKCMFHVHLNDDDGKSRKQKELDRIVKLVWEEKQKDLNE